MTDDKDAQTESTKGHQQNKAFGFLAEHARRAHYGGDGFVVTHVSTLALKRIHELKEAGNLGLTLKETLWAMSLGLYWSIDRFVLDVDFHDCRR